MIKLTLKNCLFQKEQAVGQTTEYVRSCKSNFYNFFRVYCSTSGLFKKMLSKKELIRTLHWTIKKGLSLGCAFRIWHNSLAAIT